MKKMDFQQLLKNKLLWLGVCALLVLGTVGGLLLAQPPKVEITALRLSGTQAEPDTAFHLQSSGKLTEEELRAGLVFTPAISYALEAQTDGSYLLTPVRLLEAGTQLSVQLGKQSFTFPVAKTLLVTSFLPLEGSTGIPVSSGIEFRFNQHNLSLADFKAAVSISPAVEVEVSSEDGRFILYPSTTMSYSTDYTVSLKAPLATPSGFALREDTSFTFTTISQLAESTDHLFTLSDSGSLNVLPDEPPLVTVYLDELVAQPTPPRITVTLSRYGDAGSYQSELDRSFRQARYVKGGRAAAFTGSNTTPYATFEAEPFHAVTREKNTFDKQFVIPFPQALPPGQYLAELSLPTGEIENGQPYAVKRQLLIQSSDLSIFFLQTGDDLLLWVNDTTTGEPVPNAVFNLTGDIVAAATTGADGTALVSSPGMSVESWNDAGVFSVTAGDRVFMGGNTFDPENSNPAQDYISYLFTDRPIYRTTDTLRVWGMVRPRSAATPAPQSLLLQLDQEEGIPVKPDAAGLFTATIPLKNHAATWCTLALMQGEDRISAGVTLRIEDYVKPIYTGENTPTKPVFFLPGGDSPAVSLDVTLFDGTPVPGFAVGVESWDSTATFPESEGLATDSKGHLQLPVSVGEEEGGQNSWYPRGYQYRFFSRDAEAESFSSPGTLYVIHRDLMLSGEPVLSSDRAEVTISANRLELAGIKTTQDLWDKEKLKGAPADIPVNAQLTALRYHKVPTGTAYDYINKVSTPTYRYEELKTVEHSYNFTTQGGSYTLKDLPRSTREVTYYLLLSAQDSGGRRVEYKVYLAPPCPRGSRGGDADYRYSLAKQPTEAQVIGAASADRYDYDAWQLSSRFTEQENVTFRLQRNGQPLEKMTGRLLCSTVQRGIQPPMVSTADQLTLPYSEALLPNYVITGAYFDGKHLFCLEDTNMYFDPKSRELEVQLAGDQESYKPAGEVKLAATVTEKATGKPAANADLVVAVADEAVFALQPQSLDILGSLYGAVYDPSINRYTSRSNPATGGAANMGGGGGEDPRSNFKDTAYFATGKTDGQGKVSFSFTLPDNITSWRASALALTQANHAGGSKQQLIATKPFFVTPVLNERILLGDSFTVGLRSAGTAVTQQDEVQYTVTLEGPGGKQSSTAASPLREYAPLLFTAPENGSYTVTVAGSCKGFTDSVRLPFTVVPAGVEVTRVKTFQLAQGIQIDPLRYPVTLSIYDQAAKTYNRVLASLTQQSYGQRADMRIARKYVAQVMEERGDWYISSKDEDISALLSSYMSIFPYTRGDMDLTAQLHLALPDMLQPRGLGTLSREELGELDGRLSSYHLEQVLAKAMTLEELTPIVQGGGGYDLVDKLNYAAAYAVGGDLKAAGEQYATLVTPRLKKLTGLDGEEVLYLPGEGAASEGDCTAAAFRLAALLGHRDAEPLVLYLVQKGSPYEPYIAEQLLYLERYTPKAGEAGKFSYTQHGKTETVTLDEAGKQLTMDKAQLENAKLTQLSGQVYVDVYYTGAPQDSAEPTQKKLGITKTITPLEGSIATGKLVKITLTPSISGLDQDIGETGLVIDDYIPSGMRFEQCSATHREGDGKGSWYLDSRQGQRLRFTAFGGDSLKPIIYYARCSAPGDYVVESAFISSASSPIWGASARAAVAIGR